MKKVSKARQIEIEQDNQATKIVFASAFGFTLVVFTLLAISGTIQF